MRLGSPEYWDHYQKVDEQRKPRYARQIRDIQSILERGTKLIKAGHRIAGLNPDAVDKEIPITEGQRTRLRWNLHVLVFRLTEGHQASSSYCLPDHLAAENPQVPHLFRYWDYNQPKNRR